MSQEGTTRPSPRAVQRLASDVGGEVADLRSSLRHALDEADRFEADGRPDRAAAVLAEQQELLVAVHRRLEDRLAEAAVEREAEGVVAAVVPLQAAPERPSAGAVTLPVPGRDGEGIALRLLASAAAAAVGVLLLVVPDAGGMLTVAGWSAAEGEQVDATHPGGEGGEVPGAEAPRATRSQPTADGTVPPALGDLSTPGAGAQPSAPGTTGAPRDVDPMPWLPGGLGAALEDLDEFVDDLEDAAVTSLNEDAETDQDPAATGSGEARGDSSGEDAAAATSGGGAQDTSSGSQDEATDQQRTDDDGSSADDTSTSTRLSGPDSGGDADDTGDGDGSGDGGGGAGDVTDGSSSSAEFERLTATDTESTGAGR